MELLSVRLRAAAPTSFYSQLQKNLPGKSQTRPSHVFARRQSAARTALVSRKTFCITENGASTLEVTDWLRFSKSAQNERFVHTFRRASS